MRVVHEDSLKWALRNNQKRANLMNDTYIVTVYVVIDDLLKVMQYRTDGRTSVSAAEILTIAVVSAKYFQNHHERAVCVLQQLGYVRKISVSRFNRRLHALHECLEWLMSVVSELFPQGQLFIIDTLPVPVCKVARAKRCRKVQGRQYAGYCAAKGEPFWGWQLHLVCDRFGVPVTFDLLPARWDELVPVQYLLTDLPAGSQVIADKGYVSAYDCLLAHHYADITLIPRYRHNMADFRPLDQRTLLKHRSRIETVNSQLEKMGLQRLHARTHMGFFLKVLASLLALAFANIF